ncbi:MAG: hypothetical protein KJ915_13700 [Candidatus Omnitrophica bacterium]|nr:hypothetical protein [Candidatus Omnitrophota bacterium]
MKNTIQALISEGEAVLKSKYTKSNNITLFSGSSRNKQKRTIPMPEKTFLNDNLYAKWITKVQIVLKKYNLIECIVVALPNDINVIMAERQLDKLKAILEIEESSVDEKVQSTMKYKEGEYWPLIEEEYSISKKEFGRRINFVKGDFKRKIIFRDVEQAYILAVDGFNKPALILAGAVIEELLRLYLEHNNIKSTSNKFTNYIEACQNNNLLKKAIHHQTNVARLLGI